MTSDTMTRGDRYEATEVGPECPLSLGEQVTVGNRWTSDIFGGGTILEQEFIRADGTRVMLVRGPRTGATLKALPQ
jgi:hypothetical protein